MIQKTYKLCEPDASAPSVLLSRTSLPDSVAMTTYKKLICMTVKSPDEVRVLSRTGKHSEAKLDVPIKHLKTTENSSNHSLLFYGVGEQKLCVINPNLQASENMDITVSYASFDETLVSAVAADHNTVLVFTTRQVHVVDAVSKKILKSSTHSAKLVDGLGFDYHSEAKIFSMPSKSSVQLLNLESMTNVLAKPWEPHPGSPVTFVKFFQTKTVTEGASDVILILTAANHNSEIRFWSFNLTSKRFVLKEEVILTPGEHTTAMKFDIAVTPSEEYITLCSKTDVAAVVMEVDRVKFSSGKITTWKSPGPSSCCVAQIAKVWTAKSVRIDLLLTIRTESGVLQLIIDEVKVASVGRGSTELLKNWFPPASLASASMSAQQRLTVSSSLQGDCKALSAASESNVANVMREQASNVNAELQKLDKDLLAIQRTASMNMRILESKTYEQMASQMGKEFAQRNKGRLAVGGVSSEGGAQAIPAAAQESADAGVLTENQQELIAAVEQYSCSLANMTKDCCSKILTSRLDKALQVAFERARESTMNFDATGSTQLYVSESKLTSSVQGVISTAASEIKTSLRKIRSDDYGGSNSSAKTHLEMAQQYIAKRNAAFNNIKKDLREVKGLVENFGAAESPALDPNVILMKCISVGQNGDWPGALRAALHSQDTTVLLNLLESEECRKNIKNLTQPTVMEMADFLGLALQLSYEIQLVPGAIPSRIENLHAFILGWDDYLQGVKVRAPNDSRSASMLKLIAVELGKTLQALTGINTRELPRSVRVKYSVITKIISDLIF